MGMAASQARYLALVARKSNCEFEGQQINQARTVLSNQSANLFNQMLGLKVPVPPSVSDYTRNVYTYNDGLGKETKLTNWQQLSRDNADYNYVVTRSYSIKRFTGSVKKMNDPQVQISRGTIEDFDYSILGRLTNAAQALKKKQEEVDAKQAEYEKAKTALAVATLETDTLKNEYSDLFSAITYQKADAYKDIKAVTYNDTDNSYILIIDTSGETFYGYEHYRDGSDEKNTMDQLIADLQARGITIEDPKELYYNTDKKTIAFKSDLEAIKDASETALRTLNAFFTDGTDAYTGIINDTKDRYDEYDNKRNEILAYNDTKYSDVQTKEELVDYLLAELNTLKSELGDDNSGLQKAYNDALEAYKDSTYFSYIGNNELTYLEDLSKDQLAELKQVVKDMQEQGIESDLINCFEFDPITGDITGYRGGIYSFKMNGVIYYTSFEDMQTSYSSGTGPNHIDGQTKLPYYNATYIDTTIEEVKNALVETDGNGRFTSVRFEDDSIVYTLNVGVETDNVAYQDAMNQYYYDNAVYDKMIRDINAKTSIIQQEDQQLELRLKQLDTEQKALSTEMEAVQKIVKDNVDKTFNTFGG